MNKKKMQNTISIDEQIDNLISKGLIIFSIENFKVKHSMKGKDVANLFKVSGALEFIVNGYEMLHTQGKEYVLEEIEIFLKNRCMNFDSISW